MGRDSPASHRVVPTDMLRSALTQLTTDWARSSFTRRSAGLPGLICKIVASEPGGRPRTLLPVALETLLECAHAKVDLGVEDQDETKITDDREKVHMMERDGNNEELIEGGIGASKENDATKESTSELDKKCNFFGRSSAHQRPPQKPVGPAEGGYRGSKGQLLFLKKTS